MIFVRYEDVRSLSSRTILTLLTISTVWGLAGTAAAMACLNLCVNLPEWVTRAIIVTVGLPGTIFAMTDFSGIDFLLGSFLTAVALTFLVYLANLRWVGQPTPKPLLRRRRAFPLR